MGKSADILNELESISTELKGLENIPDYDVPDDYFDRLPGEILNKITKNPVTAELSEISPLISKIPRYTPYQVPEGFFSGLQALSGNLTRLNPVTEEWPKTLPYQVPENYFDQLPSRILGLVNAPGTVRVIPIRRKTSLLNYAAAAVTVGFIVLAATLYLNKGNPASQGNNTNTLQLASLPDQAIMEYLQLHAEVSIHTQLYSSMKDEPVSPVPSLVSGLSSADLMDYLDNTVNTEHNQLN